MYQVPIGGRRRGRYLCMHDAKSYLVQMPDFDDEHHESITTNEAMKTHYLKYPSGCYGISVQRCNSYLMCDNRGLLSIGTCHLTSLATPHFAFKV